MRVAVTGASGHVGANLVRALLTAGHQVRALIHRDRRGLEGLAVEAVEADLQDPPQLTRAFAGCEVVYHLAAYISILQHERKLLTQVNVEGTRNVLAAAAAAKVRRVVQVSSIEALMSAGGPDPIDETPPVHPARLPTAYARSKAQAEQVALEANQGGLEVVIVNPTAVVGAFDFKPSHFGQVFIDFAHQKLPALVPGGFDLVDAEALAQGIMAAADRGRPGERYLLPGSFLTMEDIARALEQSTGAIRPRFTLPHWLVTLAACFTPLYYRLSGARPRFTRQAVEMLNDGRRVSAAKAERELGYQPREGQVGIRHAVDWFRSQGMIHPAFRSKLDLGLGLFVGVVLTLCATGGVFLLFDSTGWERLWGALGLGIAGAYAYLTWPVRYDLQGGVLTVRGGPFRWRIPLEAIREVLPSRNPMGSPAWSLDRLKIRFREGGRSRFLLISPKNRRGFLEALVKAEPRLKLTGDQLTWQSEPLNPIPAKE